MKAGAQARAGPPAMMAEATGVMTNQAQQVMAARVTQVGGEVKMWVERAGAVVAAGKGASRAQR